MAGTGFCSASSGSQMRAASVVPSVIGINVCSITRTVRGNVVTITGTLQQGSMECHPASGLAMREGYPTATHSTRRRLLAQFRTKSALPGGSQHSHDILLQQIERDSQEHDVLHKERNIARHGRKSGSRIPSIRHEWDNGDRRHESQTGTKSAEN